MSAEIVIAVVAAVVSLISVAISGFATYRTTVAQHRLQEQAHRRNRAELADELFRRYREPLLWSAHSLQSRLFNAISRGFLTRYLHSGDPEVERYVRDNTVYVLAEYLGWLEVLRREQSYLDIGDVTGTKEFDTKTFFNSIARTRAALGTDTVSGPFRVFRGQQRAIGELMLTRIDAPDGVRHEVLGYASFCARLDDEPRFAEWFDRLRKEVDAIEAGGIDGNQRLIKLQHSLIDLIDLLDPDKHRLPGPRERLQQQAGVPLQALSKAAEPAAGLRQD